VTPIADLKEKFDVGATTQATRLVVRGSRHGRRGRPRVMKSGLRGRRAVLGGGDDVLQLAFNASASPTIWSKLATLVRRHRETIAHLGIAQLPGVAVIGDADRPEFEPFRRKHLLRPRGTLPTAASARTAKRGIRNRRSRLPFGAPTTASAGLSKSVPPSAARCWWSWVIWAVRRRAIRLGGVMCAARHYARTGSPVPVLGRMFWFSRNRLSGS